MPIAENKYHSTVKVEFRDLIENMINSNRKVFHVYSIHRLLSLGLLIDFTFRYVTPPSKNNNDIFIELDLKEYGNVLFNLNTVSNYGGIANTKSMEVLNYFLDNYKPCQDKPKKRGLFDN